MRQSVLFPLLSIFEVVANARDTSVPFNKTITACSQAGSKTVTADHMMGYAI